MAHGDRLLYIAWGGGGGGRGDFRLNKGKLI